MGQAQAGKHGVRIILEEYIKIGGGIKKQQVLANITGCRIIMNNLRSRSCLKQIREEIRFPQMI